MVTLSRAVTVLLLLCNGAFAALPTSYDVVWNKAGVNGSADSMPLGGGDVGLNTWYENGKPTEQCIVQLQSHCDSGLGLMNDMGLKGGERICAGTCSLTLDQAPY
jgi:hypothetical protein